MAEDFNKIRAYVRQIVDIKFKYSWQFKLEIEDQPEDMDIYVKDITFGPTEIGNEPVKIGGRTLTYPNSAEPVTISMNVRDNEDERVAKFFDEWGASTVNKDGTVGLPFGENGYVKKVKRYALSEAGDYTLNETWEMILVQRGDVSESRDEPGMIEFPVTMIQFRS